MNDPKTIDQVHVGDEHRDRILVDDAAVRTFAELSGDKNRIHLDDEYARSTRFGGRIAHGALLMAYVSKVLGMDLPGPGAVYLTQTLEFVAPVFVGDTIDVILKVTEVDLDKRIVTLASSVVGPKGEVMRGTSQVKLPKAKG
ncbi:MaoC family dehydratase [Myxococcota bacterium]|nr:MaoC family dehydratase [Myxococcota bacterium]